MQLTGAGAPSSEGGRDQGPEEGEPRKGSGTAEADAEAVERKNLTIQAQYEQLQVRRSRVKLSMKNRENAY